MKVDFDKTREAATGRWLSIFRGLGIEVNETGKHGKCPSCGGTDRFRVDRNVAERGTYFCSQCGAGDGFSLIQKVMAVEIGGAFEAVAGIVGSCEKNPVPKEPEMTPEKMRKIFNGSKPVAEGDPVASYLVRRKLTKIPQNIRYHPKCYEAETQQNQKAMLAIFIKDGSAMTMHRTYIDADGNKLPVGKPKKILPCIKKKPEDKMPGGACQLFPIDDRKILGIAEGIETAIAASQLFDIPVWAALSAEFLDSFDPPKGLRQLVIFADNDLSFTGQKVAYSLANRATVLLKIPTKVCVPATIGDDWADVVAKGAKA